MVDDMKLPPGKTCNDCYHCYRCTRMFGAKPENTHCDFSPSRFVERKKPTSEQEGCGDNQ